MLDEGNTWSSIDQLKSKCAAKILEGLDRQFSKVGIFGTDYCLLFSKRLRLMLG